MRPVCRAATIILTLSCLGPVAASSPAGQFVHKEFEESDELLLNPDCGWVAYNYEDGYAFRKRVAGGREPFALASVMYTRHPSKGWEDEQGGLEGSQPLRLLENWMSHGRHVAFRIYANSVRDLPERLRGSAQTFTYRRKGETRSGLTYWDPAYVEHHRKLVRFLGKRLGTSPYLAFVDVGGVGNTGGEWFFAPSEAFRQAGLDDETHFRLVRSFVEMYRAAFPGTRLFISYECVAGAGSRRADVMDLLLRHDVGLRDDGLGGWPFPRREPPLDTWPMPTFWPRLPVLFEGGGQGGGGVYGWVREGKDPERILQWAFERTRPTYINMGGNETVSEKACAELPELLVRYGRKLGYRFVLLRAACPAVLERGQVSELEMTWANRGIAPCYADHRIEITLCDPTGAAVLTTASAPEPATTQWAPGRELKARVRFSLPATVPTGDYVLKVSMLSGDARAPARRVKIGTRGCDEDGRYSLGPVRVAR